MEDTPKKNPIKRRGRPIVAEGPARATLTLYCRKCQKKRQAIKFYDATDKFLDTNGKMSICTYCCNEMYNNVYVAEMSMEKAFFKMCRMLNVRYTKKCVDMVKKNLEKLQDQGKGDKDIVFSLYMKNLRIAIQGSGESIDDTKNSDLTFQQIELSEVGGNSLDKYVEIDEDKEYLEKSWGKHLEFEDYLFLEESLSKWMRTTKCDTYAEELLVRELCHKENEIRKARLEGKSVDSLVKSLQEIMKNSALTPALQNASATGRSADAFGVWIKDIENTTPAEWYDQQDKYRDIEGIDDYNQKYITRAIKNFITGSRDFNVEEISGGGEIDDGDE